MTGQDDCRKVCPSKVSKSVHSTLFHQTIFPFFCNLIQKDRMKKIAQKVSSLEKEHPTTTVKINKEYAAKLDSMKVCIEKIPQSIAEGLSSSLEDCLSRRMEKILGSLRIE